ncbi:hypothetical protein QYF61_007014 [Mycteria americana]|uniref:Uncharacterized protein n=1 Tax=Mycteria americana TaxID=33587 RepID=A0AAN7MHX3_MYCAM|nr:hypothetical protein QYF61_007014 [Mycteria americana]
MSSQFLQENAVGNMRHHKEHIFYISYHHLGASICHHPHQRCDSARQISQRPVAVFSAMCNQEGSSPSNPQSLIYHGELEDLGDFTEELVQGIDLAEGYGKCIGCVQHSMEKPTAPGSCCHFETSSAAQEGPVVQGFADGQVTIVGHYCEERILCCDKEEEEKDLYNTSCIGDIPGVPQGIGHGFGDSGGDGAQVKNREVEEEEVHGGVEAVVTGYSSDDEAIAQEGSQVHAQEEPEVQELQLPCVCKCQEEELGGGAAVGHLLSLCKGPGQGGKGSDK